MNRCRIGFAGIACILLLAARPAAADACRVDWMREDGFVAYGVLEQVQAALDASEPQRALDLAATMAEANPECTDAQLLLGWLELSELRAPNGGWIGSGSLSGDEFYAVLRRFESVVAQDPDNAAAHFMIGIAYQFRSTDNPLIWPTADPLPEISSYRRTLDLESSWQTAAARLAQAVFAYYLLLGATEEGPVRSGGKEDTSYEDMLLLFADWRQELPLAIPYLERYAWLERDSIVRVGNAVIVAHAMMGDVERVGSSLSQYVSADIRDDYEFRCTIRFLTEQNLASAATVRQSIALHELCPDYALAKN